MQRTPAGILAPPQAVRRPALWVFTLVALGLITARAAELPAPHWLFLAALALALGAIWLRGLACRLALGACVLALSAGWWGLRFDTPRPLATLVDTVAPSPLSIEGVVLDSPLPGPASRGRFARFLPERAVTRFRLQAASVFERDAQGAVSSSTPVRDEELLVSVAGELVGFRAGDRVRLTGMVRAISPPMNPGEADFRLWAAQERVAGRLFVSSAELIEHVDDPRPLPQRLRAHWLAFKAAARERSTRLLGDALRPTDSEPASELRRNGRALLAALLLGERAESLRDVEAAFTRLGLAHIVAISGVNLTILAWAALALVRLSGDRGRLEPLFVAGAIALYLVVVPAQTPILRAGAMALVFLLSESLGRRYDRPNTLAWIGVAVLAWRPLELWSPGFQLSFGVVAALLTLVRPATTRWFGPRPDPDHAPFLRRCFYFCAEASVAALVAWLVATPAIMVHFSVVSPLAPLATILLGPPMFALLLLGYAAMLLSAALPSVGALAGPALESFAGACAWAAGAIDRLPGAMIHTPAVGPAWAAAATSLAAWWLRTGWGGPARFWKPGAIDPFPRRRPRAPFLFASAAVALSLALAAFNRPLPRETQLRVDTLAVADGACHLLRSARPGPLGAVDSLLWDCGASSLSFGERALPAIVRALGAPRGAVPIAVITHPNLDHYAAILDAADALAIRTVCVGESFIAAAEAAPAGAPAYALRGLRERGVEVRVVAAGDTITLGACTLEILAPPRGAEWVDVNDSSLVARVTTPSGSRMLLTGDIAKPAMVDLVRRSVDLRADALEAPHHGAAASFAFEFVQRVDPLVVVQSTGPSRVADPRWATVKTGRRWFVTAVDGAISLDFPPEGPIRARTFRGDGLRR